MPPRDAIAEAMEAAVEQGVFPGAVLFVRRRGRVLYRQAFGQLGLSPEQQPVSIETVYDLASLTKPLATATAILCLVQDGRIQLEDSVQAILPELTGSQVGHATFFHLLNHSSGLPAWLPFFERISEHDRGHPGFLGSDAARQLVLDTIRREALLYPIGSRSVYSDLGFMLLGMAIERITGHCLSEFCQERIYDPIGTRSVYFMGGSSGKALESSQKSLTQWVAPTEDDPWRGRVLLGEVHDENAYALGGVAGHAGLFGTVGGVAAMTGLWLECHLGRRSFLAQELVRRFTSPQTTSGSSWGLGWDTPSVPSSSGTHFSPQSFGHLGFTGTSVWIDPVNELEVALLSNRVHPTRRNTAIQQFRPIIHDVIYEQVGKEET